VIAGLVGILRVLDAEKEKPLVLEVLNLPKT